MGAIQNEINQLLGTSALVAGGAKHMKNEHFQKELSAKENIQKSYEEAPKEYQEIKEVGKQIDKVLKTQEELDVAKFQDIKNAETPEQEREVAERNELAQKVLDEDRFMAKTALNNVALKIQARKEMLERSKKILGIKSTTDLIPQGEMRSTIEEYNKKLGGKK